MPAFLNFRTIAFALAATAGVAVIGCKNEPATNTAAPIAADCGKVADSLQNVITALEKEKQALHAHADSLAALAAHAPKEVVVVQRAATANVPAPNMVFIKGGSFSMGSNDGDPDEKPVHEENVANFYLAESEVTVSQFKAFCAATGRPMPSAPAWGWKDDLPMCNVTWHEAQEYCQWLSKATGKKYRLPTESEWEYAARGGNLRKSWYYAGSNNPGEAGWYSSNAGEGPKPVKTKKPNDLGIYDMSGNVWEWCADWYAAYPGGSVNKAHNTYRACRGGSWNYGTSVMRCADRGGTEPSFKYDYLGFRIARN